MKFLAAAIALLGVFGVGATTHCEIDKPDLIQTGNIEFNNDGSGKEHCYTVNIDYKIPKDGIQTAVSTNNLHGYRPAAGLDYSVRAKRKDNANALSLSFLPGGDSTWKKVSVSYLATSRDDITAGSFLTDTYQLFGCSSNKNTQGVLTHNVQRVPNSRNLEVATFISGIKSQDKRLDVELANPTFDNSKKELSVKILAKSNPSLENVHVSYVIWNPKSELNIFTFDPTNTVLADYQFIGTTLFDGSIQNRRGLASLLDRLSCVGSGCKSPKCLTERECKKYGGIKLRNTRDCLLCGRNQKIKGDKCVPDCKQNQYFKDGECLCKPGFIKLLNDCIWTCNINEVWKGKCVCDDGFAKLGGVCRKCPKYSTLVKNKCICDSGYEWDEANLKCKLICGKGQVNIDNKCECLPDLVRVGGVCKPCPSYSHVKHGKCVCATDYEWHEKDWKCYPLEPTCPPRSKWNQKKLVCECKGVNQYLIDGLCRKCASNEAWNGEECACVSGYYKIDGVCRTCDPHSTYNGRDCVCNHGFFGNADKCEPCHSSCGKCKGPKENQCITCTDVSYDLIKGKCIRNTPCPTGLFLDGESCKPCSSYCDTCESENICNTCIDGFKLEELNFFGQKASYCSEICGDGKRFQVDCDDGNNRNNDGCNKNCEVQKGYHCQGGSSIKPSSCVSFLPDKSYISTTGTVHLFGRVVQGIRLSYIPPELTANECALCSKLLWVRVIDSKVVPGVRINYLPKSKYQFLAQFEFNGLFAIPVFAVSIQINPDYAKYFSASDLAQIEVKKIDPSTLKKYDQVETLDFNSIHGNQISLPDQALEAVTRGD